MTEGKKLERIVAEVPVDIKRRAQAKAALEGRPLKEVLVELLREWLARDSEPAKIILAA